MKFFFQVWAAFVAIFLVAAFIGVGAMSFAMWGLPPVELADIITGVRCVIAISGVLALGIAISEA